MPGVVAVYVSGDLDLPDHHGFVMLPPTMNRPPLARGKVRFVGDIVAMVDRGDEDAGARRRGSGDRRVRPVARGRRHGSRARARRADRARGTRLERRQRDGHRARRGHPRRRRRRRVAAHREPAPRRGADGAERHHRRARRSHRRHDAVGVDAGRRTRCATRSRRCSASSPRSCAPRTAAVGGGFGPKQGLYVEFFLVAKAAQVLDRPVKWAETRSENMLAMHHGRAQVHYAELGLKRDGTIVGLRVRTIGDAGAYPVVGAFLPFFTQMMSQQVYRTPKIDFNWQAAVTNTTPTAAYRGAGRPEATHLVERMLDIAADELDIDPVDIRRMNFIPTDAFPYTTLTGATYDSGDYEKPLDAVLEHAGYDELRAEQAARRARNDPMLLGIGLASYVEITAPVGLAPRMGQGRDRRRRHRARVRRYQLARPGSRDRVLDDRERRARRADGTGEGPPVRHRDHPAGRWHRRFAVAADRRQRGEGRERRGVGAGQAIGRAPARGEPRRHRHRRRRAPSRGRPGARALVGGSRGRGEGRRAPARDPRGATRARADLRRGLVVVPVRRAHRGRRDRSRDRAESSCCGTSRSTTAERS